MSRRKRFKVKCKQKTRRQKRLAKLREKSVNIGDFFYDGHYIGPRHAK
jgi:hypothetical protein